ncbi:hypothetical protein [Microbacterium sp. CIAB417]|uniref:hypothetical protein n=1 Tax=Microbacterium sp. CIAB417 TaxID=2860287 RepID=UPI001FADC492|nr:hypothetical protein [Microbacterium sp. CIAB417]
MRGRVLAACRNRILDDLSGIAFREGEPWREMFQEQELVETVDDPVDIAPQHLEPRRRVRVAFCPPQRVGRDRRRESTHPQPAGKHAWVSSGEAGG